MSKQKTLELFHNLPEDPSEVFNKAFELYRQSPVKNTGTERRLNMGYTPDSLAIVLYEVQKVYEITDLEKIPPVVEKIELRPVQQFINYLRDQNKTNSLLFLKFGTLYPKFDSAEVKTLGFIDLFLIKTHVSFYDSIDEFRDITGLKFESDLIEELLETAADQLTDILLPEEVIAEAEGLKSAKPENIKVHDEHVEGFKFVGEGTVQVTDEELKALKETFENTPAVTEETPKFRDEYPFLKDPECPSELKILATDKITTYNAYQEAHAKLAAFAAGTLQLTETEQLELAETATANFEASAAIKKELDHYLEHKEILGTHPVFIKLAIEREVEEMDADKCHKFINSTKPFISRNKSDMAAAVSEDVKAGLQAKLDLRLQKLALVKKKLGLSE
ncbi:hypothetical protein [Flavobacterium psychrotrophum]|uniref:hypothetical protein n=1 Tax=Flavobacterium psychrotrophum TaxID=2294119 RepID=UPI000E31BE4D|nr:hypothetical protein [Flavobacterium psychrotrophum]